MAWQSDIYYLKRTVQMAEEALQSGNDGFACLLVDPEGEIILEQRNAVVDEKDPTAHDALTLIKKAAKQYAPDFLWKCTLYTSIEPCCMCTAAAYWANLGNIKFAVSERELIELLGGLDVPSREVIAKGPKEIKIEGPFAELHDEAMGVLHAWVAKILA